MYSWGITLMIVGALSFILPILGRQFIVVSALGLTGMGSALAGIVLFGVGLALFNAARTKESEEMATLLKKYPPQTLQNLHLRKTRKHP